VCTSGNLQSENILQLEYLSLCYLAGGTLLVLSFRGIVDVDWCFMTVRISEMPEAGGAKTPTGMSTLVAAC